MPPFYNKKQRQKTRCWSARNKLSDHGMPSDHVLQLPFKSQALLLQFKENPDWEEPTLIQGKTEVHLEWCMFGANGHKLAAWLVAQTSVPFIPISLSFLPLLTSMEQHIQVLEEERGWVCFTSELAWYLDAHRKEASVAAGLKNNTAIPNLLSLLHYFGFLSL